MHLFLALAYAMNNEFAPIMADEMKKCCENKNYDPLTKVQSEITDVKQILHKNIEELVRRGETLDEISRQADDLANTVRLRQNYKKIALVKLSNIFSLALYGSLFDLRIIPTKFERFWSSLWGSIRPPIFITKIASFI